MSKVNSKPNIVFVFGDQWRAQACGYAGDPNVKTPNLDALAADSVNFVNAVSGCPVCSPYRASLLTGQYPLTHGVFLNDVLLDPNAVPLADVLKEGGYNTAYIGKWHLDGPARSGFVPPARHQGFDYWKVLNCTHDYNDSAFYAGSSDKKEQWEGYDAIAQTHDAEEWLKNYDRDEPFLLMLSWGPPHAPYQTAPERFRDMYDPAKIEVPLNVPEEDVEKAQMALAGYYAHISALDECLGSLLKTLAECELAENTIFVFTSDHGDMLFSRGSQKKQQPWDESVRVPFLLRFPADPAVEPRTVSTPIDAPDIMPTLLSLCGVDIPDSVEGCDLAAAVRGQEQPGRHALLMCVVPFAQWNRKCGGREYRGLRTERYTYVRDLNGPWLLYDNQEDPLQMNNLIATDEGQGVQEELDRLLDQQLATRRDKFMPAQHYISEWNYEVDESEAVPFEW